MSDYLWDKTGEPDEEVVRLEELLGGLAHKPRALELPAEAAPRTSLFKHARRFRPALVAAAAALLLMMLAGAVVMLRQNGGDDVRQSAETNPQVLPPKKEPVVKPSEGPKPSVQTPKPDAQTGRGDATAKGPETPDFQATSRKQRRKTSPVERGAGTNHPELRFGAGQELETTSIHGLNYQSGGNLNLPTRAEQLAAKEQLVYAMRLTSAKLGEVRKMTRGHEAPTPPRSFDERNRIR